MASSDNTINILLKAQDNASSVIKQVASNVTANAAVQAKAALASLDLSTATGRLNAQLLIARQRLEEAEKSGRATQSQLMSLRTSVAEYESKLASSNTTTERSNLSWIRMGSVIGAVAGVAMKAVSAAISSVNSLLGGAIARVDTLNAAPRTFQNLGFAASDTSEAISQVKSSIIGLPTALDAAVNGVELLSGATNDVRLAARVYTAINDAVIGFGGSAADSGLAVQQLSQAISAGVIDAQTFNSMIQAGMGPALSALARQSNLSLGALKEQLSDGTINAAAFQQALISLDVNGGGGMQSLSQIAHDSTSGIATGWQNAKTAVTRGLAEIIQELGSAQLSGGISSLGSGIESAMKFAAPYIGELAVRIRDVALAVGKEMKPYLDDFVREWREEIFPMIERNKPMLLDLAKVLGFVLGGAILVVLASISILYRTFGYLLQAATDTKNAFINTANAIQSAWATVGRFFDSIAATVFGALVTVRDGLVTGTRDLVDGVAKGVRDALSSVVYFVTHLPELIGFAIGFLTQSFNTFVSVTLPLFIAGVTQWFSELPVRLGLIAMATWQTVTGWFNRTGDDMGSSMDKSVQDVTTWFGQLPDRLGIIALGLWSNLIGSLSDFRASFETWARDTVSSVVTWFSDLPTRISEAIQGAASAVGNAASDLWKRFTGGMDSGTKAANRHALGTNFAPGGLTWVGEAGPELVKMPTGSQVFSAKESRQMTSQSGSGVQFGDVHIHNEIDAQRFLAQLGRKLAFS